jgi:class 3 adenylate cyclase/tetratricopeptide (TPR) repeat protein
VSAQFPEGPLTILFSDVEGSTDLRTQRGDVAAHRILRAHEEIVRRCVAEHDGREVKALGDGFMVAFASTRRALACALAMQDGLEQRNRGCPGDEVRIRIGINTGEVVVEEGDLFGQAVNAAARIASRARPGEILVSDIVRQLAGSGPDFTFHDRGRYRLKGFPDRWHLYGLVSGETGSAAGVPFAERTPFVGREAERADLRQLLDRAAAGNGTVVLIGGEPGVGKSRLAEEVATEARQRFRVLVGHCYESGRALPYMPWVELIETAMAEADPVEFRRLLGDEAPEFARLVPELRRRLPDIPPPVELPPEQQRRYTFNSIRDYVTRVTEIQPRLLVLEDLHWADEPTLLLLEHLADRLSSIPCLIIGTYRDSAQDLTQQLTDTMSRLVRQRQARRLNLARHSEHEVEALLRALGRQAPPAKVREVIYHETDGNAFFVEEVFRHLAEGGRLLDPEGRFRTDLAVDELDVPANVRLVLERRLERLDQATLATLSVAAVAGRHLGFELWEAISDLKGDDLIDALDEAERAGLLVTRGTDAQEEYWFAHELIRQTLLTRLPAPRRRRLHRRVADALEALGSDDPGAQAGTIAAHLIEAGPEGDPAALFRHLVLAGQRSVVSAAFEDAVRHLRRAASLGQHVGAGDRTDMLFHLGVAERGDGHIEAALDAWSQAIALSEELGDTATIRRLGPVAAFSLAAGGHYREASALAERCLAALGDRAADEGGPLTAISGFILAFTGEYEVGLGAITQAAGTAERLGDDVLAGHALAWKGLVHHMYMEGYHCVDHGFRAAEVLRPTGDLWQLALILGTTAFSLPSLGRLADARLLAEEARPLADRLGAHVTRMHCGRALAMADWCETGDLDELEAFGRRDIQLCHDAGLPWESWGWSWLATADFLRGNWDEAIEHAAKAVELSPPGVINGAEWALLLEYVAYAGRRSEAISMMADRKAELPKPGQPTGWGSWAILFGTVEALLALDERAAAAELYQLVRSCAERTGSMILMQPDERLLERVAGMAAAAGGNWEVAEAHFTKALEQAETVPHRPEQAHTRRVYAGMLFRRDVAGDRERARTLLAEAEDLYRAMAMPKHMAMARTLAARS